MSIDGPRHQREGEDRSAFQIGGEVGEGGQRDIITDAVESPDEEFAGMAKTGEQSREKSSGR